MSKFAPLAWVPVLLLAAACAPATHGRSVSDPPRVGALTATAPALAQLPPPARPITVAVYDFPDQTGQHRPTEAYADYSRAVTQGAASVVVEALQSTGGGTWFHVVERSRLENLLRERNLIRDTYEKDLKRNPDKLIKPLKFAEYILEGAIVAYERDISRSSADAAVFGVGGKASSSKNFVSVTMRLVKIDTGEVVKSVTTYRSVNAKAGGMHSVTRQGDSGPTLIGKYPSVSDVFEMDVSHSKSEMTQIAVREAIEAAIYQLTQDGLQLGVWSYGKPSAPTTRVAGSSRRAGEPQPALRPTRASVELDSPLTDAPLRHSAHEGGRATLTPQDLRLSTEPVAW